MLTRKPDAELNDRINGRSNNSLDASGFSLAVIVNLNQFADISRRVNSGVRLLLSMSGTIKKRIKFSLIGLAYALLLTLWGAMISGGGHFNLPAMLIISPFWVGILFWPIWGFLSVDFSSLVAKVIFLLFMVAHFAGIIFYLYVAGDSELYWFRNGMNSPTFILLPVSIIVPYLAAQIFLWARFLQDSFGLLSRNRSAKASQ